MDYKLYHCQKEIGKVSLSFEFQDYSEVVPKEEPVRFSGYQSKENGQPQEKDEEKDHIDNDFNYEYSPDNESFNSTKKVEHDPVGNVNPFMISEDSTMSIPEQKNIIKIDDSLSPLDANLSINKTPLWFKFDSNEVYLFDFDNLEYNSVFIDQPQYLGFYFRVAELPDASFLITGGYKQEVYSSQTLHFYSKQFYKK